MSFMSSSLLPQQYPACLVRLIWMVLGMGGRWPYSYNREGCCFLDLFSTARNIVVLLPSSFFSIHLLSVYVAHPYRSIDTTTGWKKLRFILSDRSDHHMTDNQSIAVHAFASRVLMSLSVDETLFPRYVILSTSFRELAF